MNIIQLDKTYIPQIIEFEKANSPTDGTYAPFSEEELIDYFGKNRGVAYGLFDEEDKLKGWAGYMLFKDSEYEIGPIIVGKDLRGKGWGKKLLEISLKEVEALKKDNMIFLTVSPENIKALNLYLSYGFKIYDFQKNVYGPNTDRLFMRLTS